MAPTAFPVAVEHAGQTLAAFLRVQLPGQSWSAVRALVTGRRIRINGDLCIDPARRLREGLVVELLASALPPPRQQEAVTIRHVDDHLVVVEKPTGISTVRHPTERHWTARRKALHPTLEDLVPPLIAQREGRRRKGPLPRMRVVHRIDKDTSGLVVFARTVAAESGLGKQFRKHSVTRRYVAVVPGVVPEQTVRSRLVGDRGDGRRGSTNHPQLGKEAVTHVHVIERLPAYTVLGCRLETGRTHQIRIHLAELGHAICGEDVYNRRPGEAAQKDTSAAPRLALHAAELGFIHPVKSEPLHWTMPLPADLQEWLDSLRGKG